jgi:hypothetical protein
VHVPWTQAGGRTERRYCNPSTLIGWRQLPNPWANPGYNPNPNPSRGLQPGSVQVFQPWVRLAGRPGSAFTPWSQPLLEHPRSHETVTCRVPSSGRTGSGWRDGAHHSQRKIRSNSKTHTARTLCFVNMPLVARLLPSLGCVLQDQGCSIQPTCGETRTPASVLIVTTHAAGTDPLPELSRKRPSAFELRSAAAAGNLPILRLILSKHAIRSPKSLRIINRSNRY